MKKLWTFLALMGAILQLAAAFITSQMNDFSNFENKYGLPEKLYLQPGGPAFIIWSVIFISFILLGIYQAKPSLLNDERFVKARPYIFLSGIGNVIWFYGDTTVVLVICTLGFTMMLVSLTKLNILFSLGERSQSYQEFWFIAFPISLFYGWITVAFPIGITLWLMSDFQISGNEFLSPDIWSTLIIFIALGIFSVLYWFGKVSFVFVSAGIWGLYWIYARNANADLILGYAALFAAIVLVLEPLVIRLTSPNKMMSSS